MKPSHRQSNEEKLLQEFEWKLEKAADEPVHAPWGALFIEAEVLGEVAVRLFRFYQRGSH